MPINKTQFLKLWLPVFVWALVIFIFSAQPNLKIAHDQFLDLVLRKAAHMFVYGVLFLLIFRAYHFRQVNFAFLLAVLYAISDEFHQHFVFGRHQDPKDVFVDTAGVAIAFLLWTLYHDRNKRRASRA